MDRQLKAFSQNKVSAHEIVVRLSGVLAFLRVLRGCDNTASWVEAGQTTIPLQERQRLLQSAVSILCEGIQALIFPKESENILFEIDKKPPRGENIFRAWKGSKGIFGEGD